jgi:hypothetical protein
MLEYYGGVDRLFANLAPFCASGALSENLAYLCLQVIENTIDRKRLKRLPR